MRIPRNIGTLVLCVCWLLPLTISASSGDRSENFEACVSRCDMEICNSTKGTPTLSLVLRLTRWTCKDDCKYGCMHLITDDAVRSHGRVHQYFGKWPFWRLAGMQEPASVLFSLLNLWAHVQGLKRARKEISLNHPIRRYYLGWGLVNVNAWIWSSVFHSRGLAILYSLFCAVVRLFHLYGYPQQRLVGSHLSTRPQPLLVIWGSLCIVLYLFHVSYLTMLPRFDYTYNMAASLAVGILHNLLWVSYSIPLWPIRAFPLRPRSYRPKHAYKAMLFALLTTAATSLELFDFPPWWRIIDAHALWHLSTVPLVSFWWSFMIEDATDEGWKAGKA